MASASWDKTIKIWNITSNNGTLIRSLNGHTSQVKCLILLPTGLLASGSDDKTIKIWNFTSEILMNTLTGHTNNVTSLAVLPDGSLVSAAVKDILIWKQETYSFKINLIKCNETSYFMEESCSSGIIYKGQIPLI